MVSASRQIPMKIEAIIKTEETFLGVNQLYHFIQNEAPHEVEYNPFRDSTNQYPYQHDHEAYYTRGNYRNYCQKPNSHQQKQQENTKSPSFNRQQYQRKGKNP